MASTKNSLMNFFIKTKSPTKTKIAINNRTKACSQVVKSLKKSRTKVMYGSKKPLIVSTNARVNNVTFSNKVITSYNNFYVLLYHNSMFLNIFFVNFLIKFFCGFQLLWLESDRLRIQDLNLQELHIRFY